MLVFWFQLKKHCFFLADFNTTFKRRRRPLRKQKQRPLFSQQQVQRLEKEFSTEKYLTEAKRAELSTDLKLTETQVKTWFQNRRTKWRKEIKDEVASSTIGERQAARASSQPLNATFGVVTPNSNLFTHSQALSTIALPSTMFRPQPNNEVFLDLSQRQQTYYIHWMRIEVVLYLGKGSLQLVWDLTELLKFISYQLSTRTRFYILLIFTMMP